MARRDIWKDEELTANFSSRKRTGRKFACRCGAKGCKGTVYFD